MARLGWEEGGNAWGWRRRLWAWEEDSMRECVALVTNIFLQNNTHDFWRWILDPTHGYSVRGAYHFLTSQAEPATENVISTVWHRLVPSKVSLFAWRLLQDRISTKSNLVRRHILQPNDNICVGGCGFTETTDHLFIGCALFGNVWNLVSQWLGIYVVFPRSIKEHYLQFTQLAALPRATHSYLKIIWLACVWAIWKDRNNCVFKNAVINIHSILEKVKMNSFLWLSSHFVPIAFGYHDWWRHPLCCMDIV